MEGGGEKQLPVVIDRQAATLGGGSLAVLGPPDDDPDDALQVLRELGLQGLADDPVAGRESARRGYV